VQAWVRAAVDEQLVPPIRALLALAAPLAAFVEPVVSQVEALATDLTGKLAGLLLGPGSVSAITDAVQGVVQRLRDLNLGFLTDGLHQVFADVRSKLDAVDPATIAAAVGQALEAVLGGLDVASLLPPAQMEQLDQSAATLLAKLQALDPEALVVAVVQPEFEEKVIPILDAFDVTVVLDALIAALSSLKDELQGELDRVNQAYQAMLAAIPAFDPMAALGDLSLDVDVGVDIGSPF
jgi:hypothetical protein